VNGDGTEQNDVAKTALLERRIILVAAVVAMIGGFFPWSQPLDLTVWGYDDGDGLLTLACATITFLLAGFEWRKITAGATVAIGGFVLLVAFVNATSDLGPGIVLATIGSLLMVVAGLSAVRKFE
jgi:cell division protein FtsW (lipid II flippase)